MATKKFDWGEMLSITGQEKKKYKNAERMHEIVTELSNLDAWINEATRKKGELGETNKKLEALKNSLTKDVKNAKKVHTEIAKTLEGLRSEIEGLHYDIESGCAEHKSKLAEGLRKHEAEIEKSINGAWKKHNNTIIEMHKELEHKQKLIDAANETLADIKSKLG